MVSPQDAAAHHLAQLQLSNDAAVKENGLPPQGKNPTSETDHEEGPQEEEEGEGPDSTPLGDSSSAVGQVNGNGSHAGATRKKKKKSKAKKVKEASRGSENEDNDAGRIKIARNKHMRFISSYHGPWLQLPFEILDSLFQLNVDPKALAAASDRASRLEAGHSAKCRACAGLDARDIGHQHVLAFEDIAAETNEKLPLPIDAAVFRNCAEIRNLIDTASDLAVRAASGLSAAALGAIATSTANSGGSVAAALGLENTINGRSAAMSATRQHRLRVMAVSKLAQAYSIDEVAASVAIMQGATAIDDIAEKVLKQEPSNVDAMLVHFFHERIPSAPSLARSWAKKLPSTVLDTLIEYYPERLNYFRTLGIWHAFKQDYQAAIQTYDRGLQHAYALRMTKKPFRRIPDRNAKGKKKGKAKGAQKGTAALDTILQVSANDGPEAGSHVSLYERSPESKQACEEAADLGKEAGDDVERQLLFFRGMAKFQMASGVIESQVVVVENISKPPGGLANEGGELTLDSIGIKIKPEAPASAKGGIIGSCSPTKLAKYEEAMTSVKAEVVKILKDSLEDFKSYLAYFPVWEAPAPSPSASERAADTHERRHFVNQHLIRSSGEKPIPFRGRRLVHHRALNGRSRYTDPRQSGEMPVQPALLTPYHPLLIEAHFSVLLILLLIGDFEELLKQHYRCARLMEYLEGYPIFVPARSTNQSEYVELLELLSNSWARAREKSGVAPPPLTAHEDDIASSSGLSCLHHLVNYFSEEHNERLTAAAAKAEEEAIELAKDLVKDRKGAAARTLLEKKLLEDVDERQKQDDGKAPKQITNGNEAATPPAVYNTARAEVALAWLHLAILPEKQEREGRLPFLKLGAPSEPARFSPGPSTSSSDQYRDTSGRPVSPGSASGAGRSESPKADSPGGTASLSADPKGKGKARAIDDVPDHASLAEQTHTQSRKGKGKGRAM